jgi:hypothetical protein
MEPGKSLSFFLTKFLGAKRQELCPDRPLFAPVIPDVGPMTSETLL